MIRLAVKARGSEVQKTMAKYTKRRDKRGYEWKSAYREKEAQNGTDFAYIILIYLD
ncbi:hypothetical protein ACU7HT_000513 [Campylobacter jejuni]